MNKKELLEIKKKLKAQLETEQPETPYMRDQRLNLIRSRIIETEQAISVYDFLLSAKAPSQIMENFGSLALSAIHRIMTYA